MMSTALCVNLLIFVPLLKEAQNIINQVKGDCDIYGLPRYERHHFVETM